MKNTNSFGATISRRNVLKGAAATGVALGTMNIAKVQSALAADPVVRGYGVTTSQLRDWSRMEDSIGIEMDFTGTDNVPGIFLRDVMVNELGDEVDIFVFEAGTQDILGPRGFYAELDRSHPELTLWDRTEEEWRRSDLVIGPDDKTYGVPVIGNADSFGFVPEALGVENPEEELSYSVLLDDERTRGRASLDQTWTYSMTMVAQYLKHNGLAEIENVVDMTGEEARQVVDYLIERKQAGQFRTLHSAFEEQIQLLVNREVDVLNCWEPAVREANRELGENTVYYAYTVEGYFKWGHAAYVASQAMDRDNVDNIYKVLNYYLGGEYRALQARDRGYGGPNMDLGIQYAKENDWSEEDIRGLEENQKKIERKFAKPYWSTVTPENASEMEEEWQRFLNA
ncbi:MAG: twin-arginine translocation signal domain-containing protein [Pseudomonadota bacterium]